LRINKGITTGNIIQIAVMLIGLAVLWGGVTEKVDYIETEVNKKANKEVVEIKFEYISVQLDKLESLIKEQR